MKDWTVVLKTPDGLAFEVVRADYATWDDDSGRLEFFNTKPGTEMLAMLSKLKAERQPVSETEGLKMLTKFLTSAERMKVAGFSKDSVAGYFEGRSGNLKIDIHMNEK